eukprot:COSAG02_NODE_65045_length_259_cov_0.631250_1_plen_71_part_01
MVWVVGVWGVHLAPELTADVCDVCVRCVCVCVRWRTARACSIVALLGLRRLAGLLPPPPDGSRLVGTQLAH